MKFYKLKNNFLANGIYETEICSTTCFAFECNIYDIEVNSTTYGTEVRVFGAGCSDELQIWCDDLWKENAAKINKNEAFTYSGSHGSVVSCSTKNCATANFVS